ncbi:MAG: glucosamine-6-phosphate deaminase, partial [Hungatella sp.]
MRLYRAKDYKDMSRKAANIISAQVITKPDCVLGLATGSTPIGTYQQLIEWYRKGDLDFSQIHTVNLDEYKGLTRDNNQSYYYFMYHNFFKDINVDPAHTNIPNGTEPDSDKECTRYDHVIEEVGGIDL